MTKLLQVVDAKGVGKFINVPTPVNAGDIVNKAYVDDILTAGNGTTYLASYGDATPSLVYIVPAGIAIANIDIEVTEVWDGAGASIKLGVVGDLGRYFAPNDVELTALATFSKDFSELGPHQVVLTISPGASPTSGKIRIQISTTAAGT